MNILMLNWRDIKNPKSGGAEIVTMEHLSYWVKKGHSVVWFTSRFKDSKKSEKVRGVKIIRYGNFLTVYLFAFFYYLKNRKNVDFVVDQIHGIPFFTPVYVRKPKIAYIHEVAGDIWDHMYPFPINMIGKFFEKYYFKFYKNTIFWVPSESTAKDLIKNGVRKEKCVKILGAINNKTLSRPAVKDKIPTLIFVSRLVKMKGVEEVIKAFFIIQKKIPNIRLHIVGDGEDRYVKTVRAKFKIDKKDSSIKFFGFVPQSKKIELLGKSNLILHASIKEGWGLVIVEAASQGTPSVVYDVGGLRESTLNNKTGIVLDKNTPEEMARVSIDLISDKEKYRKFQNNCLQWSSSLTWDKSVNASMKLLERTMSEAKKS